MNTKEKLVVLLGSLLPVAYIWSLPLLCKIGFAFDQTKAYKEDYVTVSGYITSAQANGAWAAVWFYPLLNMWIGPSHKLKSDKY